MFRKLVVALTLALTVLFVTPAFAGYEALFETVRQASWAIYLRSTGGLNAVCSAEAFASSPSETKLLTAGHCFIGADLKRTDFMVTQDHKTFIPASLVTSGLKPRRNVNETSQDLGDYEGDDWAIVSAKVGNKPFLPVGKSAALKIGEDLVIVGVPFGLDFLAVQGVVGSTDVSLSQFTWNHYFGANIFVAGGNSGSGVVSTVQKAIVGVVDAGPGPQSSMMIFLPVDKIPPVALSTGPRKGAE